MISSEKIELIVKKLKTRKSKNIIYLSVLIAVFGCFAYRFYRVANENNFEVFNIVRNDLKNGTPVDVLIMTKTDGILYEPITIKNNRGYVTGARVNTFKSGQDLGDCKIVSVSNNIDLDTGMYVIKTSSCVNGLKYAKNKKSGFYVPTSAVHGDTVYVVENDVARARNIEISDRDYQNVLVKSGLDENDVVVLSNVKDNQKIKIIK
jgi:hypothetical protein